MLDQVLSHVTPCPQVGVSYHVLRLTSHLGWDSVRATPVQGIRPSPTVLGSPCLQPIVKEYLLALLTRQETLDYHFG